MRIRQLNVGTLHPDPANFDREWGAPFFVCRCLVVEVSERVVVVDTGIGLRDSADPSLSEATGSLCPTQPWTRPQP